MFDRLLEALFAKVNILSPSTFLKQNLMFPKKTMILHIFFQTTILLQKIEENTNSDFRKEKKRCIKNDISNFLNNIPQSLLVFFPGNQSHHEIGQCCLLRLPFWYQISCGLVQDISQTKCCSSRKVLCEIIYYNKNFIQTQYYEFYMTKLPMLRALLGRAGPPIGPDIDHVDHRGARGHGPSCRERQADGNRRLCGPLQP